jgi:hypothetical protein
MTGWGARCIGVESLRQLAADHDLVAPGARARGARLARAGRARADAREQLLVTPRPAAPARA